MAEQIAAVLREIQDVDGQIQKVERQLEVLEGRQLSGELSLDERKQLLDKANKPREEKKQLRDEKKQLRDKENKLRDEKNLLLRVQINETQGTARLAFCGRGQLVVV